MPAALRELRSNPREPQRCAKKLFAQRHPFPAVIAAAAIRCFLAKRFERLTFMRETRSQNRTVADRIAAGKFLLDDQAELVAALQRKKIDVPLEDVGNLLRELRPFAFCFQRIVERALDARGNDRVDFVLDRDLRHNEKSRLGADGVDFTPTDDLQFDAVDTAVGLIVKSDEIAGPKPPKIERPRNLTDQCGAFGAIESAIGEQRVQRVARFDGQHDRVCRQRSGFGSREISVAERRMRSGRSRIKNQR